MTSRIHAAAGSLALLLVASFWMATVTVELLGDTDAIVWVKTAIPWGLLVLVPALVIAGGSGQWLARGHGGRRLAQKRRRMRLIAANGVLMLVPAAFFLAWKAAHGAFDGWFVAVQGAELAAGAVNATLLALNMRDGFALSGTLRRPRT